MANGAQVDSLERAKVLDSGVGQGLTCAQISVPAEIEMRCVEFEAFLGADSLKDFQTLRTTSGPVPSPGITATRYVFPMLYLHI